MTPEEITSLDALERRDSADFYFGAEEPLHKALDDLGEAQRAHLTNLHSIRDLLFGDDWPDEPARDFTRHDLEPNDDEETDQEGTT